MEDVYKKRFEKLSIVEKEKVVRILESVGIGQISEPSDYELSNDATQLVIDIIRAKVLRV
jgi:hypothetical protein